MHVPIGRGCEPIRRGCRPVFQHVGTIPGLMLVIVLFKMGLKEAFP